MSRLSIKLAMWFTKNFDYPKYQVGEPVIAQDDDGKRVFGVVTAVSRGVNWEYKVRYEKPITIGGFVREAWTETDQSLSSPYIMDYPQSMRLDALLRSKNG